MKNSQSPIEVLQGYGATGMKLTLNLQQCQKLGSIYNSLCKRELTNFDESSDKFEPLSNEEHELGLFLQVFKDFSIPESDLWNNLLPKEEEQPFGSVGIVEMH